MLMMTAGITVFVATLEAGPTAGIQTPVVFKSWSLEKVWGGVC